MLYSIMRYHPRIGYTYIPNVKSRVPCDTGGYLVRTNSAGFRSDREFVPERPPGTFRAILFGDSQTAGYRVANGERFSDLIEKAVPGLEVFNYGINGTGTDQQYLAYLDFGNVDHDLLILGLYVEDIGRVSSRYLKFKDENDKEVYYAKPYFEVKDNELALQNVPVPKRPLAKEALPAEEASLVGRRSGVFPKAQAVVRMVLPHPYLRGVLKRLGITDLVQKVTKVQRNPGYDAPDNPGWQLLRKIIETWIRSSRTPVLLVPIPAWTFIEGSSDPTGYQTRIRELADATGCFMHDPLPDLLIYPPEVRRSFRFQRDTHLSPKGHQALARSLTPVVERIMREGRCY